MKSPDELFVNRHLDRTFDSPHDELRIDNPNHPKDPMGNMKQFSRYGFLGRIVALAIAEPEESDDSDPKNVRLRARLSTIIEMASVLLEDPSETPCSDLFYTLVPIQTGAPWSVGQPPTHDPNGMAVEVPEDANEGDFEKVPEDVIEKGPFEVAEWGLAHGQRIRCLHGVHGVALRGDDAMKAIRDILGVVFDSRMPPVPDDGEVN